VICFSSGLMDDSWNRRRFIAAHELAHHYLWNRGGFDLAKNESLADCIAEKWTGGKYRNRCTASNREKMRGLLGQSSSSPSGQSGLASGTGTGPAGGSSGATTETTTTIPSPPATINPRVLDLIAAGESESRAVVEDDNQTTVVNDNAESEDRVDHPTSADVAPDLQPTVSDGTGGAVGPVGGAGAAGSEADSEPEPLSGVYQALLFGITLGMFRGYGPLQRLFAPEG